nr:hypothetical protein [Butyrivibrio sp. WCE2006]
MHSIMIQLISVPVTEGFYRNEQGRFYTLTDDFTYGHRYLITELIYDSKTGQFKKGKVTDKDWAY